MIALILLMLNVAEVREILQRASKSLSFVCCLSLVEQQASFSCDAIEFALSIVAAEQTNVSRFSRLVVALTTHRARPWFV